MTALLESLDRARQAARHHIIQSQDISRSDRELLVRRRWLQPIVRGWYLLVRPDAPSGESSPWYASFWDFLGLYLQNLYQDRYCLSAESSLDFTVNPTTIPKQVIAVTEKGNNVPLALPFGTSLLTYADPQNIPEERIMVKNIQVMPLPLALCRATPSYFIRNPKEAQIALQLVKDPAEWVHVLIRHDFKRAANRIIGAYQFLNDMNMAQSIQMRLEQEHFPIAPENPFVENRPLLQIKVQSPYVARIYALWNAYREKIIPCFPSPVQSRDKTAYLAELEKIYTQDAYNSLSIEGYRVDEALIARMMRDGWNLDATPQDQATRDALAALGYHGAFQSVKTSIGRILDGASAAAEAKEHLHEWMQHLFQPLVEARLLRSEDLLGYRRGQVYIRGSRHVPFPREALLDSMEAFFDCLTNEPHPAVRAVLGHFLFVYIHPYMDGNGRTARFLMNAMFASGGYPWTVIQVIHRTRYFTALESASVESDIIPLAQFIAEEMHYG